METQEENNKQIPEKNISHKSNEESILKPTSINDSNLIQNELKPSEKIIIEENIDDLKT